MTIPLKLWQTPQSGAGGVADGLGDWKLPEGLSMFGGQSFWMCSSLFLERFVTVWLVEKSHRCHFLSDGEEKDVPVFEGSMDVLEESLVVASASSAKEGKKPQSRPWAFEQKP